MVRTRGGSFQVKGWTRPTTSVCRSDRGASSSIPTGGADAPVGFPDTGEVGYLGGPSDVSLLVSYNHHVALKLW